jgi:peptide/nickel transport system permease protein
MERVGNTLLLMFSAIFLAIVMGIALGTLSAYKQYSIIDSISRSYVLVGRAAPSFWLGLMAMLVFGVWLDWFPVTGTVTLGGGGEGIFYMIKDRLWHMFLPVVILSYSFMATYTRMTRTNMLNILNQDFIRTARSKGLRERDVLIRHALKNAFLPIITLIGMNMGRIISGAVIIETIFGYPGMGSLTIQSVLRRDYSVIMAIIMITGILIVVSNLITDLFYAYLDPRIEY